MTTKWLHIFLITSISTFSQCRTKQALLNTDLDYKTAPVITTLVLEESRNKESLSVISIVNKEGFLKNSRAKPPIDRNSKFYKFQLIDHKGNIVKTLERQSILIQDYEVPSEDGTINRVTVSPQKDSMILRFYRDKNLARLRIIASIKENETVLQWIDLNQQK